MDEQGDGQKTLLQEELTSQAVIWLEDGVVIDLFGDRPHACGNGNWCDACREEIRAEAMLWLRELNGPPSWTDPADADYRLLYRWNENTMLADHSIDP